MSILPSACLLIFVLFTSESQGIKLYINRGWMPRPAESMEVTRDKKNQLFWYPMKRERFTPRLMENLNKIDQTLQTDLGEASMLADEILLDLRSLLTDVKTPAALAMRANGVIDDATDPDDPKRLLRISKKSMY